MKQGKKLTSKQKKLASKHDSVTDVTLWEVIRETKDSFTIKQRGQGLHDEIVINYK